MMVDPVEWLKAQVEAYLTMLLPGETNSLGINTATLRFFVLQDFIRYVEEKYKPKGLFDR